MNRLDVEVLPPNEWGGIQALLLVDGQPLIDLIRDLEAPSAAADGQPDLAGAYDYLSAATTLLPSRHLFGETNRTFLGEANRVSALVCECGDAGCWPLRIQITLTEQSVIWSEPQQPHRPHWVYPPGWYLAFDRDQYTRALQPRI